MAYRPERREEQEATLKTITYIGE